MDRERERRERVGGGLSGDSGKSERGRVSGIGRASERRERVWRGGER